MDEPPSRRHRSRRRRPRPRSPPPTRPAILQPLRIRDFRLLFARRDDQRPRRPVPLRGTRLACAPAHRLGPGAGNRPHDGRHPARHLHPRRRRVQRPLLAAHADARLERRSAAWSSAIVAALVLTGRAELWHLYVLAAIFGVVDAFFYPALNTIIPMLVPERHARAGERRDPGLGPDHGAHRPGAGRRSRSPSSRPAPPSRSMRPPSASRRSPSSSSGAAGARATFRRCGEQPHVLASIAGGMRAAWADPAVRGTLVLITAFNLAFTGPISVGLAWLADERFAGGSAAFGLLFSVWGGGALIGAVIGGSIARSPALRDRAALGARALWASAWRCIGLAPTPAGGARDHRRRWAVLIGFINVQYFAWLQRRVADDAPRPGHEPGDAGLDRARPGLAGGGRRARRPRCGDPDVRGGRRRSSSPPRSSDSRGACRRTWTGSRIRRRTRIGRVERPDGKDRWWDGAVLYQVYPRSFADANGDGIGDLARHHRPARPPGRDRCLAGRRRDLALARSTRRPLADVGYDVSDYRLHDAGLRDAWRRLDALIAACHERGIRLLLDLVPCHTSIEHPWFVESRSSRESPKRDWYIWGDPAPAGGRRSNWDRGVRRIGVGAGTRRPSSTTSTRSYPEQPDLNWRNPEVADAMPR